MDKDTEVRNSVECVEKPQELVWLGQEGQGKGQQGRDGGAHGPHHVGGSNARSWPLDVSW